ncbi:TIGR04338 family metallohydrolase [Nocardia mexicana]|uniref:Putative metallohydrolase (TIGR04338 family) n=1 Tax=Nocardia mexicana TaxID=279262 RepID=A0A370GPS9_9NOCA|nr:TIGR04338 family metallohydrolase [Nocardia mexicana]RDI45310.1 putative metallohydrolase (TIGR04338 family) [Nocardia mexicana]
MTRARDTQRHKVYDAEQRLRWLLDQADTTAHRTVEVFGSRVTLPVERRMGSLDAVTVYVGQVLALGWVRARWARARIPVGVRERRSDAAAHYEFATATIAVHTRTQTSLREVVVLHELAHHLQPPATANHGPEFCGVFADLTGGVLGPEAQWLLRTLLHDAGAAIG